jgi:hypothetical protein
MAEQKEPLINNGLEAAVVNLSLIGLRAPGGWIVQAVFQRFSG